MKRTTAFILSLVFFLFAFLILYFTPGAVQNFRLNIYNSDHLFPLAFLRGIFTPGSSPDWAFSAYTPYLELLIQAAIYFFNHNIHLTISIYAVIQPLLTLAGLLYLGRCTLMNNKAILALIATCAGLPILIFASGKMEFFYYQFVSYGHYGSAVLGLFALGLLILICASPTPLLKSWPALIMLCLLVAIAVGSDPLFTTQFIAPVCGTLVILWILKVLPFRKAVYPILCLLYAAALGFFLYRLPFFWGGDRVYLFGSNIHPNVSLVIENWGWLLYQFSEFFKSAPWAVPIWIGFYLACLGFSIYLGRSFWQGKRGGVRGRLLFVLLFFFLQMCANIASALLTDNTNLRYMHPILYTPLAWGWPFLAAALPGWLTWLRGKKALAFGLPTTALVILLALVIMRNPGYQPPNLADYYPELNACFDRETSRLGLHRGIGHYWQARPLTLLSKTGLAVVQVSPDLAPFMFLGNSDWYYEDQFDFIIIDRTATYGYQIDPGMVLARFGPPAATATCGSNDILVYNRATDDAFRHQFDRYLKPKP